MVLLLPSRIYAQSTEYSRGDESQADAVGAVILYKAGYNPQGMADFFKTMQEQGGEAPPQC